MFKGWASRVVHSLMPYKSTLHRCGLTTWTSALTPSTDWELGETTKRCGPSCTGCWTYSSTLYEACWKATHNGARTFPPDSDNKNSYHQELFSIAYKRLHESVATGLFPAKSTNENWQKFIAKTRTKTREVTNTSKQRPQKQ